MLTYTYITMTENSYNWTIVTTVVIVKGIMMENPTKMG